MLIDPDPELVYEVLERIERRTLAEKESRLRKWYFWTGLGLFLFSGCLVIAMLLPGPK